MQTTVNVVVCFWWYSFMLCTVCYAPWFDVTCLIMMTWCMLYDILLCTMMCTFYMHITCWWWWWVFDDDVLYDDMLTLHGMMIWYDEHACLSTMMYSWWYTCNDALWCSCTRWWLWLWCKLDAYSMILIWWCTLSLIHVFTWYDAVMLYYTLSRCIPCVQHKQSRVTCSVIM